MADKKVKPVTPAPVVKAKAKGLDLTDAEMAAGMEAVDDWNASEEFKGRKQDKLNQQGWDNYQKSKSYAKGGSVSARADGCAQRGKTRGKMV